MAYPDTLYVDTLIAPDTVNTMPEATLRAVQDHGHIVDDSITSRYADAAEVLGSVSGLGIDYHGTVDRLEREGVRQFVDAWSQLLDHLKQSMAAVDRP